jgi:hypothetical protein
MADKIYQHDESVLHFVPATAAQAEDVAFEVHNLAAGAGRQSAQLDLGVSARATWYAWRAFVQFATIPVVGETVDIYIKTSDGTHPDNDDGTSEGAVSSDDKLKNLTLIGTIVVDEAVADIEMVASGVVSLDARYVQIVFENSTADALTNDVDENGFNLTPVPQEVQTV